MRALDNDESLSDLSNGIKFGQSMIYNSGQYSAEIHKLHKMAFSNGSFSIDYENSNEFNH